MRSQHDEERGRGPPKGMARRNPLQAPENANSASPHEKAVRQHEARLSTGYPSQRPHGPAQENGIFHRLTEIRKRMLGPVTRPVEVYPIRIAREMGLHARQQHHDPDSDPDCHEDVRNRPWSGVSGRRRRGRRRGSIRSSHGNLPFEWLREPVVRSPVRRASACPSPHSRCFGKHGARMMSTWRPSLHPAHYRGHRHPESRPTGSRVLVPRAAQTRGFGCSTHHGELVRDWRFEGHIVSVDEVCDEQGIGGDRVGDARRPSSGPRGADRSAFVCLYRIPCHARERR